MLEHEERPTGARPGGDVTAGVVTIRQGGVRSISANEVTIRQGGAARVHAKKLEVLQGGVGLATTGTMRVTAGGVVAVLADGARLEQSVAQLVAARSTVEMDQAAAGAVVARSVTVRDSTIGLVVTPDLEGRGIRVLFGPRAAFAFGAGLGCVLWLLGRFRR